MNSVAYNKHFNIKKFNLKLHLYPAASGLWGSPSKTKNYNLALRKKDEHTVFGTCWSPGKGDNRECNEQVSSGCYLASCADSGHVCFWDIFKDDGFNNFSSCKRTDNQNLENTHPSLCYPLLNLKVSENTLYDIDFFCISNSWFMSVCGDDGVLLYKWDDIVDLIESKSETSSENERYATIDPIFHFKTYLLGTPNMSGLRPCKQARLPVSSEINGMSIDESRKVLFGAAGDSYGFYQWDLETGNQLSVTSSFSSENLQNSNNHHHDDYLHCVKVVPGGNGYVLTGGEDGKVGLWDSKESKLVEMISMGNAMKTKMSCLNGKKSNVGFGSSNQTLSSLTKKYHCWVSSIDAEYSGNWAVIGGGVEDNLSSLSSASLPVDVGGFLSMWHLPTRTITSSHTTRESLQCVRYHSKFDAIVTGGNENVLSYWSWSGEEQKQRICCSPMSCFSVAVNKETGYLAASGAGNVIDVFTTSGSNSSNLYFC